MNVRPYSDTDRIALEAIVATCPETAFFADPNDVPNTSAFVAEEDGRVLGVVVCRLTVEPFLYVDQTLQPCQKWSAIETLAEGMGRNLAGAGIKEIHLFPSDERFARRLTRHLRAAFGDVRCHVVWNISRAFEGVTA
jgi:hypothetical protein